MLDLMPVGEKEVRLVLSQRREVLKQELRRLDDTLGFYGEKPVEPKIAKEPVVPRKMATLGPSQAILQEVAANPGQKLSVIVNGALAKGVRTKAKDQKHLLRNTVDVMLKGGKLKRLDGKLYASEAHVAV